MAIQAQLHLENSGFPLCGFQEMDNLFGNESCFLEKHHHQRQNLQQLQNQTQQMNHNMLFGDNPSLYSAFKNNITPTSNYALVSCSQSLMTQMETQGRELDQYIRIQNERLRLVLQQQSKQQLAVFLKNIESKAISLLKQKDTEIAQAIKKRMELEEFLKKLEIEREEWRRVAQENEAKVVSLNNALEELREKVYCDSNNDIDDAESCCQGNREEERITVEKNRGLSFVGGQRTIKKTTPMMTVCKSCNSGESCMLFLPCRHLCSCKACEPFLDSCPVCGTLKKTSIEALIF